MSTQKPTWTFLTNHGHALVCIAQNPDIRISEIAALIGIGERAAHRVVSDLVADGFVVRTRVGRRNTYTVDFSRSLRHPLEANHAIGEVFKVFTRERSERSERSTRSEGVANRPEVGKRRSKQR